MHAIRQPVVVALECDDFTLVHNAPPKTTVEGRSVQDDSVLNVIAVYVCVCVCV